MAELAAPQVSSEVVLVHPQELSGDDVLLPVRVKGELAVPRRFRAAARVAVGVGISARVRVIGGSRSRP